MKKLTAGSILIGVSLLTATTAYAGSVPGHHANVANLNNVQPLLAAASTSVPDTDTSSNHDASAVKIIHLTDIAGHWAQSEIQAAVQAGYVSGFPDHTFKPDAPVTRAQFMKMLAVALKLPVPAQQAGEAWYQPDVDALVKAGIHHKDDFDSGYNSRMSRLGMMRIADRAVDKLFRPTTVDTTDEQLVLETVRKGLINGVGKGNLDLEGTTTRAQAVTVIDRILQVKAGKTLPMDAAAVKNAEYAVAHPPQDPMVSDGSKYEGHTNINRYYWKDGKIYFNTYDSRYGQVPVKNYRLKEDVNPNINQQMSAVTKALLDTKFYTDSRYVPAAPKIYSASQGQIDYTFSSITANDPTAAYFNYIFAETNLYDEAKNWQNNKLSNHAFLQLNMNSLFTGNDYPVTPYIAEKLKSSLSACFGGGTKGQNIADYVYTTFMAKLDYYNKHRSFDDKQVVKHFGNIEVDYVSDAGADYFFFSYDK